MNVIESQNVCVDHERDLQVENSDHTVLHIDGEPGPSGPSGPVLVASQNDVVSGHNEYQTKTGPLKATQLALVPSTALPVKASSVDLPADHSPASALPDGFALFDDGIYELPVDETAEPIFICTPLRVDAVFANQAGEGWGKCVSVQSWDSTWHKVNFKNAELLLRPTDVVATLVDRGLELGTDRKSKERLLGLLKRWKPEQRRMSVTRMGWVDGNYDAFTLGANVIGATSILPLLPQTSISSGLVRSGTLDDWKTHVGAKCNDNPLMILAVSLAFSGPLLAMLGQPGGGLHFRGSSSSGKTTLLKLAASVWGSDKLITQWRATANGMEAVAANTNDMFLALDEIAEIEARELSKAIYMLANGTGKTRMTKDAGLADLASWRLALMSSGEISVEEKLAEARLNLKTGHEVRLIDIEADTRAYGVFDELHGAANGASFSATVQQAARRYHGVVGPEFVQMLISYKLVFST